MNKLAIFLFLGVVFSLAATFPANAKDCGGAIKCDCGDNLTQSHTMDYDIINCSSIALNIQSDNLNLNCNGHTINSPGSTSTSGIYIGFRNRVNVSNCNINGFFYGIDVESSTNITLKAINLSDNLFSLYLYYSSGNRVENIISSNNHDGLYLFNSNNNIIKSNLISNNENNGIYLYYSSNNDITQNTISHNYWGIDYSTSSYDNKIEYNNIIDNRYYNFANYNSYNISAENNWWGFVSPFFIDLGIWDFNDYDTLGRVDFEPFLYGSYYKNQVPIVSNIKCYDGLLWKDCDKFGYNSTLQRMRVNCTDRDGSITKARFELKDISDYDLLASGNATLEAGYWVYNNPDLVLDYNGLVLTAWCSDNNSNNNTLAVDWLLRDGLPRSILFYEGFNYEESILKNNGTINRIPRQADTRCGKAADLTSNAYLSYPLNGNFPNQTNLTIEFWVKNSHLGAQGFFDIAELYGTHPNSMAIFHNGAIITEIRNNVTQIHQAWASGGPFIGSKWNHVAMTFSDYDRGNNIFWMTSYFNGRPGLTIPVYNFYPNLSDDFWVGRSGYYGYSNAYIDEFKIFNYAKSNEEVYSDYLYMVECTKVDLPRKECVMYKPESKGNVKINCSGLFVDNESFMVKGVGYQPIPIGMTAELVSDKQKMYNDIRIRERDFPLLRAMGANTIRTWYQVLNKSFMDDLYNEGINPIYVLMGFWINCNEDYGNPSVIQKYKDNFTDYVNEYKDHPSVLAWMLGNENNLGYCSSDLADFYRLANELAKIAYELEGETYHPVAIVNGDLGGIGDTFYGGDDESLNYTDFWGINAYRGKSFGSLFSDYSQLTGKPMVVTEYGTDALNNSNYEEMQEAQVDWNIAQWKEIKNNTLGGTIMAYSDEWWKGDVFGGCGDKFTHDYSCGHGDFPTPDGWSNEEWFGVMRTVKNPDPLGADIMEPRLLYYALQQEWAGNLSFNLQLNQGWNLISIPLSIASVNVSSLFPSGRIYGYNGSWFVPKKIDPKQGYWVKANNSIIIPIVGVEVADKSINLNNGWNLIGHPYLQEKNILELFENATVYLYNSSWSSYIPGRAFNSLQKLKPGYGYWVKKI